MAGVELLSGSSELGDGGGRRRRLTHTIALAPISEPPAFHRTATQRPKW